MCFKKEKEAKMVHRPYGCDFESCNKKCFVRFVTWKMYRESATDTATTGSVVTVLAGMSAARSEGSAKQQQDENFKRIK